MYQHGSILERKPLLYVRPIEERPLLLRFAMSGRLPPAAGAEIAALV